MRLLGNRAVAHRPALEAAQDRLDRFHLVDAHRLGGGAEVHHPAQRAELLRLVVDERRVLLEDLVIAGPAGVLELVDRLRVGEMELSSGAVLIVAARREAGVHDRPLGREAPLVPHPRFLGDDVDADAADARGGPGEVLVDEILREAHRLEDLRAVVALDGADPHLGDHLHQALDHRLQVFLLRVGAGHHALLDLVVHRLEREVRVDRARAVAHQEREVVHLARLSTFHDQAASGARPLADEVVMDGGDGEKRRDGRRIGIVAAVGEDQQVEPLGDALRRLPAQVLQRAAEGGAVALWIEERGQLHRLESVGPRPAVERADPAQLVVGEDGRGQSELPAALRPGLEQVSFRPDRGLRRHDDLLADGVDRRIRHLREELLEVVEEELRTLGEHGERRVGPHRPHRFVGGAGHRPHEQLDVLRRVAEDLLAPQQQLVVGMDGANRRRKILDPEHRGAQPLAVRRLAGDALLDLLVGDDALLGGIHQEQPPGLQPALLQHLVGRDVEDADLGRHHHEVVVGHVVAGGAQAVPIEHRADANAVGEGDRRRAVPGFHQARVELVEGLPLRAHGLVARPGLRDHHHDRVRQLAPGERQQLEDVVEHRRVGALGVDDGEDLQQILAEQLRAHHRLARVHPVDVAPQRVDLAIVRDVAVRVRASPGGEGVGGETRVHHADGGHDRGVLQVEIEPPQLAGVQHPLVDDRLVAQAGDVEVAAAGDRRPRDLLLHQPADHVQLALERGVICDVLASTDEDLPDDRLARLRRRAQGGVVGRYIAPTEQLLPFPADGLLEQAIDRFPAGLVRGQEDHADAVAAASGQGEPELLALGGQEGVGRLQQDPRPVARVLLCPGRAAVLEVQEHFEGFDDDVVRRPPLDVGDEPESAGIMLERRVVKPLAGRITCFCHRHLLRSRTSSRRRGNLQD